jgi:hexosaminidase
VLDLIDARPSGLASASFAEGSDVARRAWAAIVALDQRSGSYRLATSEGARVRVRVAPELGDAAYRLDVDGAAVTIEAAGAAGVRHAMVTLAQWLREGLPARATVADRPRYPFRGLHIDLARQWFEPDVVARLIDVAAWRKLSHLHLHLSDDEGWRIPVDQMPELATAGVRGHGLPLPPMLGGGPDPVGRTYTRDEIAGWVERADELGVVLVPEIDMPAHVHAALTARPDLRDPDDTSGARSVQHFIDNVLVPGHPATTEFVERVIDSLAELFPSSPSIHIGGDEVPEHAWQGSPIVDRLKRERRITTVADVEAAFHRDLLEIVRTRTGRQVGAWEEAAFAGGIRPGDGYVVAWRNVEASRQLAALGYDIVVAPGQAYYLDMALDDDWWSRGMGWAGSTSLEDVCAFDPEAGWSDDELRHLLGVQACLWTECVHDARILDAFLFPRLDAIAERAWSGSITGGAPSLRRRASSLPRILTRSA